MFNELGGGRWERTVDNLLNGNWKIRKLTPKECFRLQGMEDEMFERAAFVNSDTQLYKQAGNSITVTVMYEIAKRLERNNETGESR